MDLNMLSASSFEPLRAAAQIASAFHGLVVAEWRFKCTTHLTS
jgi:hypothetical protein